MSISIYVALCAVTEFNLIVIQSYQMKQNHKHNFNQLMRVNVVRLYTLITTMSKFPHTFLTLSDIIVEDRSTLVA